MDLKNVVIIFLFGLTLFLVGRYFNRDSHNGDGLRENTPLEQTDHTTASRDERGTNGSTESFYVLRNPFMQVVCSDTGGAIAEINLPFRQSSPQSVVLPVRFDRIIESRYPKKGRFPLHPYHLPGSGGGRVTKHLPAEGGYYPLLRRGGSDPRFYAFNTVSEEAETAKIPYRVTRFTDDLIEFTGIVDNTRIIKTYSFSHGEQKAPYTLFVTVRTEEGVRGLWLTSGVPQAELISGSPAPAVKYSVMRGGDRNVKRLSLPKTTTTMSSFESEWISNANGYFTLILSPLKGLQQGFRVEHVPGTLLPPAISAIDPDSGLYSADKYPGYEVYVPIRKTTDPMIFRFFAGPEKEDILKAVDRVLTDHKTGRSPLFTKTRSFHGWFSFISEPFAGFLFLIMNFFHTLTRSWGLSIIPLTLVLRIMMYPLNTWSIKSNLKLQAFTPEIRKIQERHKKDPKQGKIEIMNLYKKHNANPFGGCLPLLIQMPFLIGMFDLLKSTFALRGDAFIPGWIDDLTAPDILFSWSYPLPFIGNTFHLLPLLLGAVMFWQQKLAMNRSSHLPMSEQERQQQKMGSFMTIIFTVLFYKFPSGLNIYWFSSMLLQILQQWYVSKRLPKQNGPPSAEPKEIVIPRRKK
ncbi:MAG: membrane protein insertase YidC [Simkaniaceae bacterium]|nr:membrane protein insertase YidC [Simkaniaceae bacterium]